MLTTHVALKITVEVMDSVSYCIFPDKHQVEEFYLGNDLSEVTLY